MLSGASRPGRSIAAALIAAVAAILFSAAPALAKHDKIDRATTDDGAVYVGEIKSVQYATLNLNTDPAGLIAIEWRHVTGLVSTFQYRIELTGDVRHFGSLGPVGEPGRLSIVTVEGAIEVDLDQVISIIPVEQGYWRSLDGSISFGLTYTQSNNSLQYNLAADAERRTRRLYSAMTAQSIFNAQDETETTSQHYLKFMMTQIIKKSWNPFEMGQLESNPEQGYDLRLLLGGGASNYLIERSRALLTLSLGAVYNREDVSDGTGVDESAEALAGIAYRRFKRGSHSPDIQFSLMTFTTLDDSHRFRTVLNFNVSWKIVGDFKFSCQVNNSYDSQPPGADSRKTDLSVVTSIGYTF